jgi:hypothetical protein
VNKVIAIRYTLTEAQKAVNKYLNAADFRLSGTTNTSTWVVTHPKHPGPVPGMVCKRVNNKFKVMIF